MGSMLTTLSVFLCPYSKNSLGFSLKELKLYGIDDPRYVLELNRRLQFCAAEAVNSLPFEKNCSLSDTEEGLTEEIDIYRHFERSIGKQSPNKIVKYLAVEPSSVSENVNLLFTGLKLFAPVRFKLISISAQGFSDQKS